MRERALHRLNFQKKLNPIKANHQYILRREEVHETAKLDILLIKIWKTCPVLWQPCWKQEHMKAFFTQLYASLFGKEILISEKRSDGASTGKHLGMSGSDRDMSKGVKRLSVFEVESFILHYMRTIRQYQHTVAESRAVHIFIVDMNVHWSQWIPIWICTWGS